jgi:hypothetical protein
LSLLGVFTPFVKKLLSGFLFAQCPEVLMQVRVTRPVVIASTAGLRHLAPGLVAELTDAEAKQVLRQEAGSACAESAPSKTSKAKAKDEQVTQAQFVG